MNVYLLSESEALHRAWSVESAGALQRIDAGDVLVSAASDEQSWLGEPGCVLGPDDVLVVVAEAASAPGEPRVALCGLRAVEEILADSRHTPGAVLVVSFMPPPDDFDLPFLRLPCTFNEVMAALEAASAWDEEAWALVRFHASCRALYRPSSAYRHGHANLVAALRLFLGATQCGVSSPLQDPSFVRETLSRFRALELALASSDTCSLSEQDLDRLVKRLRSHQELLGRLQTFDTERALLSGPNLSHARELWEKYRRALKLGRKFAPREGDGVPSAPPRLLVVEDQWETHGWRLTLEAICSQVRRVQPAELEAELKKQEADLLLLDCNLGPRETTGLQLLPWIRSLRLDLPVVMMTAYDHAELAAWALRVGCNAFFAKQLQDAGDREPLDYFLKFLETLDRPEWESGGDEKVPSLRSLWTSLSERLPLAPDRREAEASLRWGTYLLFRRADAGDSDEKSNEALMRSASLAAVRAVELAFAFERTSLPRKFKALRNEIVHGGTATVPQCLELMESAMQRLAGGKQWRPVRPTEPAMPSGCGITAEALRQDDPANLFRGKDSEGRTLGHLDRARLGAAQYKEGLRLLGSAPTQKPPGSGLPVRIVLIDDEHSENGWDEAVRILLGKDVQCVRKVKDILPPRSTAAARLPFEVVLLDLWLAGDDPRTSPAAGLEALAHIRAVDPGLPVVMLSAATDSMNALRALRTGAFDFLPKWTPGPISNSSLKTQTENFCRRVWDAANVGRSPLRDCWTAWNAVTTDRESLARALAPSLIRAWPDVASSSDLASLLIEGYRERLLPALWVFHAEMVDGITEGRVPVLDRWRVAGCLWDETSDVRVRYQELPGLLGALAEYLARMYCCRMQGDFISAEKWKEMCDDGKIAEWARKTGPSVQSLWTVRCNALHSVDRWGALRHTSFQPQSLMAQASKAWTEFMAAMTGSPALSGTRFRSAAKPRNNIRR